MANPQKEKGYTPIANEIMEALARIRIPGEARQVLDIIFRKTYGYHKKQDRISLSQFYLATGLKRPTVVRALSKLITLNLVTVIKKDNTHTNTYIFNKDYSTWKPLSKKITVLSKKIMSVIKKDNEVLSKKIHTKDTLTKDTSTKDNICASTFKEIWQKYPKRLGRKDAIRHFRASVKTPKDWEDINTALKHYLESERVSKGIIQNGSTWFNNWRDWIEFTEPICSKCKGKGRYSSPTGYRITCDCPAGMKLRESYNDKV